MFKMIWCSDSIWQMYNDRVTASNSCLAANLWPFFNPHTLLYYNSQVNEFVVDHKYIHYKRNSKGNRKLMWQSLHQQKLSFSSTTSFLSLDLRTAHMMASTKLFLKLGLSLVTYLFHGEYFTLSTRCLQNLQKWQFWPYLL